ncbi:ATP-grasp domain-containing protein [Lysinibacillus endophyticus]|uniref:ATP-grasp domain-containing protein n=2 Tax=Ureibacillus endophyticus TaxID=1978490 RepID=A0A494YZ77_9BACL|nr:ATP-grasp domain-containing protein [Lysinibacillus endophyticus]
MLGGAYSQIPAIKKAREMGYFVIVCDSNNKSPGQKYANQFFNISTTDKESVLKLAKSLNIDGIVCYKADSGASTVAYVAEQLDLPSNPYDSIMILTNKDLFRRFQKDNGFNVPRAIGYQTLDEAKADFHNFNMPVMIKPVDSAGSLGVSKIDTHELLEEKVSYALAFSKVKRFIIEEYIENHGPHVGGDGFSVDGKLVFRCFSNEKFSEGYSNPFLSIIASWPYIMPESIQNKIHAEIDRLLNLLNMKTCAYNFDIRIDENENVYLIEVAPRNGGDWNPNAIKYATGVDLIEYTLKAALGEDCSDLSVVEPEGYWATYVINSKVNGIFKGIKFHSDIKTNIVEYDLFVNPGDKIYELNSAYEKVGIMILNFSTFEEMEEKMENISKLIKLEIESV